MFVVNNQFIENDFSENSFLAELYERTTELPIKANNGNHCISIDMRSCSPSFQGNIEEFINNNSDKFRLLVTGPDYYVEVLHKDTYFHAYEKSLRGRVSFEIFHTAAARQGS